MVDPLNTRFNGGIAKNALDGSPGDYLGTELDVGVRQRLLLGGTELTVGVEGAVLMTVTLKMPRLFRRARHVPDNHRGVFRRVQFPR